MVLQNTLSCVHVVQIKRYWRDFWRGLVILWLVPLDPQPPPLWSPHRSAGTCSCRWAPAGVPPSCWLLPPEMISSRCAGEQLLGLWLPPALGRENKVRISDDKQNLWPAKIRSTQTNVIDINISLGATSKSIFFSSLSVLFWHFTGGELRKENTFPRNSQLWFLWRDDKQTFQPVCAVRIHVHKLMCRIGVCLPNFQTVAVPSRVQALPTRDFNNIATTAMV